MSNSNSWCWRQGIILSWRQITALMQLLDIGIHLICSLNWNPMQDGIFTGHFLTGIWMRTLFYKGHVVFFCKYSFRGLHSQMVLARENKSDSGVLQFKTFWINVWGNFLILLINISKCQTERKLYLWSPS